MTCCAGTAQKLRINPNMKDTETITKEVNLSEQSNGVTWALKGSGPQVTFKLRIAILHWLG